MKNKKSLLLIITILLVTTFVVSPVEAKRVTTEAQRQSDTAGVQGNEGDILKQVDADPNVFECRKSEKTSCSEKYKTIIKLNGEIKKAKANYCNSLDKNSFKGDPKNSDVKEIVKLQNKKDKLKDFECKCSSFVDSISNLDLDAVKAIVAKQTEMQDVADSLAKEAKAYKEGNLDQPDVAPVEAGCLENGELLAWGIPSIPHIPAPKPKATTTSSSSTSAPAEQKEVSDEGYKSLRSVEIESEKVTEPEKDQFISELNSRVGSN